MGGPYFKKYWFFPSFLFSFSAYVLQKPDTINHRCFFTYCKSCTLSRFMILFINIQAYNDQIKIDLGPFQPITIWPNDILLKTTLGIIFIGQIYLAFFRFQNYKISFKQPTDTLKQAYTQTLHNLFEVIKFIPNSSSKIKPLKYLFAI